MIAPLVLVLVLIRPHVEGLDRAGPVGDEDGLAAAVGLSEVALVRATKIIAPSDRRITVALQHIDRLCVRDAGERAPRIGEQSELLAEVDGRGAAARRAIAVLIVVALQLCIALRKEGHFVGACLLRGAHAVAHGVLREVEKVGEAHPRKLGLEHPLVNNNNNNHIKISLNLWSIQLYDIIKNKTISGREIIIIK